MTVGPLAGAYALIAIGLSAACSSDGRNDAPEPTCAPAGWTALPALPPLDDTTTGVGLSAVSTGSEVFVLRRSHSAHMCRLTTGSECADEFSAWALDLRARTWRRLPPPPLVRPDAPTDPDAYSGNDQVETFWTGADWIVWASGKGLRPAMFRPGAEWTTVPEPPLNARFGAAVAYGAGRLVVLGGIWQALRDSAGTFADGASYDLLTGRWTMLPPSPFGPLSSGSAAATAKEFVFVNTRTSDAASLSPDGVTWTRLPEHPPLGYGAVPISRLDRAMFIGGFRDEGAVFGAAWRPERGAWVLIPAPDAKWEQRYVLTAWSVGNQIGIWGGDKETYDLMDGALFDLDRRTWKSIERGPFERRWEWYPRTLATATSCGSFIGSGAERADSALFVDVPTP